MYHRLKSGKTRHKRDKYKRSCDKFCDECIKYQDDSCEEECLPIPCEKRCFNICEKLRFKLERGLGVELALLAHKAMQE